MSDTDLGYAIEQRLFGRDEVIRILEDLERQPLARSKAGARHVLAAPGVHEMASDPRLLELAERFLGRRAIPFRATLFDKSADSNWAVGWHQDTALPLARRVEHPAWGPWTVKAGVLHAIAPAWALERVIALRVHLDDSQAGNGPLRVLPGTHTRGILSAEKIHAYVERIAPVECLTPVGGVVAMCPLTLHASAKVRENRPRRVLHFEYADALMLGDDIELAVG